jgi:adenine-specific DNA methylase
VASASGTHAKRVSKDVIEARKEKGLCLRCGNAGHRIRNCTYLAPIALESRSASGSRTSKISALRVRQVNEVLGELDSSDFEDE